MVSASVIICAHNPRKDYLTRVLDALRRQSLPLPHWELLLIDNDSTAPVAPSWDLSWHPNARHIREAQLGLTSARLRGIRESGGGLLVFVDDDNVLSPDYLDQALQIGRDHPYLGAWGGSISGEFEVAPPGWAEPYLHLFGVRKVNHDVWSNDPNHWEAQPCGAGLCVRRQVAEQYASDCQSMPSKQLLDRQGTSLSSCGDSDIVQTSCQFGMGFGVFRRPELTHLIPRERMTEDYMVALNENITYSVLLLRHHRGERVDLPQSALMEFFRPLYSLVRHGRRERRFYLSRFKAQIAFAKWLQTRRSHAS